MANIDGKILGNNGILWMARRSICFVEKTKDDSCSRGDVEQNVTPSPILGSAQPGTECPKVFGLVQLDTHGYIGNEAMKFSPGYYKLGSFVFQSRSIAYRLVDKSPGSTHVEVSCEGYLEHDAETNSMKIANSTPFASMNNVNILCVNQGSYHKNGVSFLCKSPGLTHVEVSCEGYLEHDAETNSMNIANSTPFASMNNVNILCVNQGS
ncbi:hypothetical protein Tco_0783450 [Tanacetum coccineum]